MIGFEFSTNDSEALNSAAFPCNQIVPQNGSFSDYTKLSNCSCAACDSNCPAPPVNASIGFFDGFNFVLVAIAYGILLILTAGIHYLRTRLLRKSRSQEEEDSSSSEEENAPQMDLVDPSLKKINASGTDRLLA